LAIGNIKTLDDLEVEEKTVLVRVDINSPLDPKTQQITDDTRIARTAPTIAELAGKRAKVVVLAHQGDPVDFQNFTSLGEHARLLAGHVGREVDFIDDVAGPAARRRISDLQPGDVLLLDNVRQHTEETVIFEKAVSLSFEEQAETTVVRKLGPLGDAFVNDAFACVHRSQPTLCGFPIMLPAACGRLFEAELRALGKVRENPERPCLFILGGAKIMDAFSIIGPVLERGTADKVLTQGLVGQIVLKAGGKDLGEANDEFFADKGLDEFVPTAQQLLRKHGERLVRPVDVAVDAGGREVLSCSELPAPGIIMDLGPETIERYCGEIAQASTVFVNGPAGVYEQEAFAEGTRRIWEAVGEASAFSVIGGGDTIQAAKRFGVYDSVDFVSTAGGGLILYMAGEELPVLAALESRGQSASG
jgi:phosphoglycerate kinase